MTRPFRLTLPLVACLLAALAIFYWLGITSLAGVVHDDVIYMVTGKALAESGAYRIISQPGAPFQPAYPPLYPAFLAVLWKLFPTFPANVWAFKAFNIGCALVSLPLVHRLVTRAYGAPRWQGFAVAALLGLGSFYVTFMDLTMSEPLFLLAVVGALLVAERLPTGPHAKKAWVPWAIALAVTVPVMVRTAGLVLPAAAIAWLLWRREWRLAGLTGAAIALFNLPWVAWTLVVKRLGADTWDYLGWVGGNTGGFQPGAFVENFITNGLTILTTSVPLAVAPLVRHEHVSTLLGRFGLGGLQLALALAVTAVTAAGLVRTLKEGLRVFHLFLAAYVAMILIYPWDPSRFVLVLSPLLLFLFVRGACWPAEALRGARPGWKPAVAAMLGVGLLAASAGAGLTRAASFVRHQTFHDRLLPPAVTVRMQDEAALAAWAAHHVPENGLWLHHRDPLLYLMTGRQAITYADGPEPSARRRTLFKQRPTFLVLYSEQDEGFTTHHQLLAAHPDKLSLVYEPPAGTFKVYRVSPEWP